MEGQHLTQAYSFYMRHASKVLWVLTKQRSENLGLLEEQTNYPPD